MSHPTPEDPGTRPSEPPPTEPSPEYSIPPAQPPVPSQADPRGRPYPPPEFPVQRHPPPGTQPPPVFPAHGYPPPGYGDQPLPGGYPAPAGSVPGRIPWAPVIAGTGPSGRHRQSWIIALSVLAVVLLACCGAATVVAAPFLSQYPATVSVPASLAGLDKLHNARADALGHEVAGELERRTSAHNAVAGLYAAPNDERHLVLVIGVSGFLLHPAREVDAALTSLASNGLPVNNSHGYGADSRGGVVKCGTASINAIDISVCGWGDHGSVGLGIFYNRPVIDSLNLFGKIRRDMVKHG